MKRLISILSFLFVVATYGCRHVANSEIIAAFHAAGGGDVDKATTDQIGAWLAKHEAARHDLTPLCKAKATGAPADWATTDEGRVCQALTRANFAAPAKMTPDGTKF
jgi:hypothetical protein